MLVTSRRTSALIASFILFSPALAAADAGLPLVALFLPPLWLGLVPIVLVEAFVNRHLLSIPFRRTFPPAILGNVASAMVGIPLTWVFLATLEMFCCSTAKGLGTTSAKVYAVTLQSPWLIPYEADLRWMIPAALAFFALPCFAVSVLIEAPINRLVLSDFPRKTIWKVTAKSNLASYLCLGFITWGAFTLWGKNLGGLYAGFGPVTEWIATTVFRIATSFVRK
jgi:hypothetical protein